MRRIWWFILMVIGMVGCRAFVPLETPVTASSPVAQTVYDDQLVELIVPFAPGGGTDTWARTLAPLLQRELGRNVRVQVVNRPGAAGVAGANTFYYNHDQNTMLVSSASVILPYLLGDSAVEYELNNLVPILGSPVGGVVFVSAETGIESATDLCTTQQPLRFGGVSPTSIDIVPLLTFELLQLQPETQFGFDGKGGTRVAFEQSKTNIDFQTTPAYLANVERLVGAGRAVPLYTFGILNNQGEVDRDPAFPDLPTIKDVYRMCFGTDPTGVSWDVYKATLAVGFTIQKMIWVHSDTPEEAIATLRQAADAAITNPDLVEAAQNLIGNYNFFVGHEAQVTFAAASNLSPTSISWLKTLLREKYNVQF